MGHAGSTKLLMPLMYVIIGTAIEKNRFSYCYYFSCVAWKILVKNECFNKETKYKIRTIPFKYNHLSHFNLDICLCVIVKNNMYGSVLNNMKWNLASECVIIIQKNLTKRLVSTWTFKCLFNQLFCKSS